MTNSQLRVAILEDHQSIIDGYLYRLNQAPEIRVVGIAMVSEDLEPLLAQNPVEVLLMDINVPTSAQNHNIFPILHLLPKLRKQHPNLSILVISMLNLPALTEALVEAGISGYIFKDDQTSIQQLAKIVVRLAHGGMHFSPGAEPSFSQEATFTPGATPLLTARQLETLSICAAYPDETSAELAARLGILGSTLRNLLSGAYLRLNVRTRAAAIARAQQLGLLSREGN
jgi:two-component system response regulator NreC